MTDLEKWQQLLIVISATAVACVPVAFAWDLFMRWFEKWEPRKVYRGPRQKMRSRRRILKTTALAAVLVCIVSVSAPARAREWREEPSKEASVQDFAYAVNLGRMSTDLGEFRSILRRCPESAADILKTVGADLERFCEKYPEFSYILEGEAVG